MDVLKLIILLISVPAVFCAYSSENSSGTFFLGYCNETNPCIITNSLCERGFCKCRSGYTVDSSKTKCFKVAIGYHDTCEDDAQCSEFLGVGATCENKKCVCGESYHYLHGRCHATSKDWSKRCNNDDECFDGSEYQATRCRYGSCVCNDGFYRRSDRTCRRRIQKVGDECMMDYDCDFANGNCVSHRCVQNGKPMVASRVETVKYTMRKDDGIKIGSNDTDCQSIGNSICDVDGSCICGRAHFATEDMTGCVPEIGESCNPSEVSLKVEHAVCRENMWTCPIDRSASRDNRQCIELTENIGETCNSNEQCRLFGGSAECQYGTCNCGKSSYYDEKRNLCWLDRYDHPELGNYCKKNSDCDTPNTLCRNNTCSCKDYFFESGRQCDAGIHAECQTDDECKYINVECSKAEKTCQCIADHVPVSDIECRPKLQYHEGCSHHAQCSATLPHTACRVVGLRWKCECEEEYYYMDGECHLKKWVDDDCAESETCHTSNSHCKSGRCQCLAGHTLVESVVFGKECRPTLEANCEKDDDCGVANSECQNNKCSCKQYFIEDRGRCEGGINATCEEDKDCMQYTTPMHCQNKVCTCKWDYLPISSTECRSSMGHHGECEYHVQCSTGMAHSFCNKTGMPRCDCVESHYFKDNGCHQKKLVNEKCSGPNECSTPNSYCNDGYCECVPELPKFVEGQCRNSSEITRSLLSFVMLIFLGLKTLLRMADCEL